MVGIRGNNIEVLVKQRPGTASGGYFIEDEMGFSKLIVFQILFDKCREEILPLGLRFYMQLNIAWFAVRYLYAFKYNLDIIR